LIISLKWYLNVLFNVLFEKARYTAHPFLRVCLLPYCDLEVTSLHFFIAQARSWNTLLKKNKQKKLKELSVNETDNHFLMHIHVKIVRIKKNKKQIQAVHVLIHIASHSMKGNHTRNAST